MCACIHPRLREHVCGFAGVASREGMKGVRGVVAGRGGVLIMVMPGTAAVERTPVAPRR